MFETLPQGVSAASACTRARGRTPAAPAADGRSRCAITQLAVRLGEAAPPGAEGFWYDGREVPDPGPCLRGLRLTAGAAPMSGASVELQCAAADAVPATEVCPVP